MQHGRRQASPLQKNHYPLPHQPQLGLSANPRGHIDAFLPRFSQMIQILFQRQFIELGEELRANACVDLPDAVDKLTFIHGVLRF